MTPAVDDWARRVSSGFINKDCEWLSVKFTKYINVLSLEITEQVLTIVGSRTKLAGSVRCRCLLT